MAFQVRAALSCTACGLERDSQCDLRYFRCGPSLLADARPDDGQAPIHGNHTNHWRRREERWRTLVVVGLLAILRPMWRAHCRHVHRRGPATGPLQKVPMKAIALEASCSRAW
eukprot:scaffold166696_cov31-Tisochrysis_lutea.AAC.5